MQSQVQLTSHWTVPRTKPAWAASSDNRTPMMSGISQTYCGAMLHVHTQPSVEWFADPITTCSLRYRWPGCSGKQPRVIRQPEGCSPDSPTRRSPWIDRCLRPRWWPGRTDSAPLRSNGPVGGSEGCSSSRRSAFESRMPPRRLATHVRLFFCRSGAARAEAKPICWPSRRRSTERVHRSAATQAQAPHCHRAQEEGSGPLPLQDLRPAAQGQELPALDDRKRWP